MNGIPELLFGDILTVGPLPLAIFTVVGSVAGSLFLRWVDRRSRAKEKIEAEKLEWKAGVLQAITDHEQVLDKHERWFNALRDQLGNFPME